MSEINLDEDERDRKAGELGLVVVLPGPRDLFIDIDNAEPPTVLYPMIDVAEDAGIYLIVVNIWKSRKEGCYHAHVQTDFELNPVQRLLLQAVLGSDLKRELLGLARILRHPGTAPTVFFETPEKAKELEAKLSHAEDCDIPF